MWLAHILETSPAQLDFILGGHLGAPFTQRVAQINKSHKPLWFFFGMGCGLICFHSDEEPQHCCGLALFQIPLLISVLFCHPFVFLQKVYRDFTHIEEVLSSIMHWLFRDHHIYFFLPVVGLGKGVVYYTVLYCNVLNRTVLYCVLYYTVLYCVLYYTILCTILYCVLHYIVLYCTVLYCVLYYTIMYSTIQYYIVLYYIVL